MFLRVAAANLLRKLRFPASYAFPASTVTTTNELSVKLKLPRWYQTGGHGWRINLRDPCLWIVISGHVAMTLGISANTTFAENATTEASSNNDLGDDLVGLRKIEDGSVGKLDEAEKLFLSAIQEAKEGFGEQDPHVASACNNLSLHPSNIFCSLEAVVPSEHFFLAAVVPSLYFFPSTSIVLSQRPCSLAIATPYETISVAFRFLAEFYRVKKAFDKAEPLYLEAINILEESFGPDDVRVGVAAHNLGQFYLGQKKLEEARVNYERALKIKRRVLGYGHSECSDTMFHLGVVLYLQGKERDAEVLIKDSIRMLEEGGEGESSIYMKSHQVAEAEMVQRKILHVMELSKGWNSLATVIAAESLALTLLASGNTKDSKDLLERCLNARKNLLPSDHIQIGANLLHLARVAMLDCGQHKMLDVSKAEAELDMAKNHLHNSIRIARECLRKVSKQKDKLKRYSEPGDSRKEGQAALAILLQSLNTLSSVELEKQELQKIQVRLQALMEGNINLEAQEALLQCISAYKEIKVPNILTVLGLGCGLGWAGLGWGWAGLWLWLGLGLGLGLGYAFANIQIMFH
ncbi:uncharacterized protein HKW66_Vig0056240 [Vigna angularis]|uniref:MalT-like TPR region domain-containing protein n=1 Tax=Phaseolus angularis TaxID=3914 RepID=A0A8T0L614_PHAAN|nr:uncharacterized protein HKW66_Vig0056240 [Vigna angularis]